MVLYNKGGRGNKNPYKTVIMRVPVPLVVRFELMIEAYREAVLQGTCEGIENADLLCDVLSESSSDLPSIDRDEVIKKAKAILKQKKSARVSVLKLLQVFVGSEIGESDLR